MFRNPYRALLIALVVPLAFVSCRSTASTRNRINEVNFPQIVLWAWERPENLEYLDSSKFAVAFLAQTLTLDGDEVRISPRRQPLKVSDETKLIAVTRIESPRSVSAVTFSDEQRKKLTDYILKTLELKNVSGIQIDYDAKTSERKFYRALLNDVRQTLPDHMPLSMTALASFCLGDRWLKDLPVDEAVPMVFRMGADNASIKNYLAQGNDFREPLCRKSYGIAVDEPLQMQFDRSRRIYIFNVRSWTPHDVLEIERGLK